MCAKLPRFSLVLVSALLLSVAWRGLRSEARPEAEAREPAVPPQRASFDDLSGTWLNTGLEGDGDAYFKALGTSWLARRALAAGRYGVGHLSQQIQLTGRGRHVSCTLNVPRRVTWEHITDGKERTAIATDGTREVYRSYWERQALVLVARRESGEPVDGHAQPGGEFTLRRFLRDANTLVGVFTASGHSITRVYERQGEGG